MLFFQKIRKSTHNFCKSFFVEILIFQLFFFLNPFDYLNMKIFLKQSH